MATARGPRGGANGDGLHVPLSPLLLGSLIAAGVATLALVALTIVQLQADPPPPPPPPGGGGGGGGPSPGKLPPPRPEYIAFIVVAALFAISWLAVIAAACRDQIMRRVDAMEVRLMAATTEYGEQRRSDGYFEGMREARREQPDGGPTADAPSQGADPGGPESRLRSVPPPR